MHKPLMICKIPKRLTYLNSSLLKLCLVATSMLVFNCGDDEPEVDCSLVTININVESTISQCPDPTGTITANATGGSGSYQYSIDDVNFQESAIFQNIGGGSYTVTIKDSDGCTASVLVTVEAESDITFTSTSTEAGCGGSSGSLTINAVGGDGAYNYKVDDGSFQSSNTFENLSNGIHTVTVRDGNNCESEGESYVSSGISFDGEIKDIITTFCAVSGCHVAGEPRPDFDVFENIKTYAMDIKARTQSRNMPRGTSLSNEQIDAIACWVDDGALDN